MTAFLKKANEILSGLPATVAGGVFLVASFVLPRMGFPAGEQLAWVCVAICGIPLVYLAVWRIVHNKGIAKISSALLISLAMVAALFIGDLFAAGEVAFIMAIGALLEEATTRRARKGLVNLMALSPQTARVVQGGQEALVAVDDVKVGSTVRVLPGETIPVDGQVLLGETSVDQSVMTGESLPVDKAPGDSVFGGTTNRFGSIDVRVCRAGEDSSIARLIRMVEDAESKQAPVQRIADKWASWLVPVALLIAIATYFATGDIVRGVTVMVVFCPCALVLATPTAVMAAIGQATKHGVVVKSGEALEAMGAVDTIAFDKTGTLTQGALEVSDVLAFGGMDERSLLRAAAAAESRSEHPLGQAIAAAARAKFGNDSLPAAEDFAMRAGRGVTATVDGMRYLLGSEQFVAEQGGSLGEQAHAALGRLRSEGKASVVVAACGTAAPTVQADTPIPSDSCQVVGVIGLSDVLRPEAARVVEELKDNGAVSVLLTGDNAQAASFFASRAGIEQIRADLLPEEKVASVEALRQTGHVCMVGDGVNDAPALKAADVGVAMGAMGTDIAADAADVVLMTDDIAKLPYLKWLANTTVRTIRGAIALSMCINFAAILLSITGVLNPTTGALVHNAGSCFVVLLAALLYDRKWPGDAPSYEKKAAECTKWRLATTQ